jgi:hypothetical protein
VFLLSRIPLFTIIRYGTCLFSNTDMYNIVYRILTRIRKQYIYFIALLLEMLCYYRLSHIASLITSACCDAPPLEKTLVPAYSAASKLDPSHTQNIKPKRSSLTQTTNVDKCICNMYAVWMLKFENKYLFFRILEPNSYGTVEMYHSCFVLGKSKFKMTAFNLTILTKIYRGFSKPLRKIPR